MMVEITDAMLMAANTDPVWYRLKLCDAEKITGIAPKVK